MALRPLTFFRKPSMKTIFAFATAACVSFVCLSTATANDDKPKYTIKQVMGKVFKGDTALIKPLTDGSATDEQKKMAVEYLEAMAAGTPKKGDAESWKEKAGAVLAAAKAVAAGEDGAAAKLKETSNCKACHSVHK